MGLLNNLLGGLAGGATGNFPDRSPLGRATAGGNSPLMMALLPIVLDMLADRRDRRGAGLAGSTLDGLGGLAGPGGLGGVLSQFAQKGYGHQAKSWVSTGPNEPIAPQAISEVLGRVRVAEIARLAGLDEDEARLGLSELLPEAVDHFTPDGHLPDGDELQRSIDEYERRLPR